MEHTFDVWTRSIWEWSLDCLQNPELEPYFIWDAERMFKFDGKEFVQFVDEPWTGSRWWEIQVSMIYPYIKKERLIP